MRKVLFIAYYFPPMGLSGVQRPLKFAKYLPDFGWEPIILTTSDSSFYAFDKSLEEELDSLNLSIYRTNSKSNVRKEQNLPPYFIQKSGRYVKSFINMPDSKSYWRKPALKLAKSIITKHKIEAIYATAPPYTNFLIGRDLSNKYNIPLTIDYRDSWVDNKFNFYPTPLHRQKAIKMEQSVINEAEKIVVISRYAKELLIKRYPLLSYDDVSIIPHGFDEDDLAPYRNLNPDSSYFTILHLGSFLDDRTPKYFYKALKSFIKKHPEAKSRIRLQIIGKIRKGQENLPKRYGLHEIVTQTGYQNHRIAVENLFTADILWLMLNDDIRTPGKLYEYFGSRKPLIITAPDGNMKELGKKTKACLTSNAGDTKSIEENIATYYKLWKEKMLPSADESFVSQFNRRLLTEQLSKILNNSLRIY